MFKSVDLQNSGQSSQTQCHVTLFARQNVFLIWTHDNFRLEIISNHILEVLIIQYAGVRITSYFILKIIYDWRNIL